MGERLTTSLRVLINHGTALKILATDDDFTVFMISVISFSVPKMDIDRISYIFGSFARRRQSHEASSAKRRSIESTNKKIFHDRSKSTPHQQSKKTISVSPRARSVFELGFDESKFKCPLCKGTFVEPRVLPCLHTFCLKCIYELERRESTVWCENGGPEGEKIYIFDFYDIVTEVACKCQKYRLISIYFFKFGNSI